MWFEQLQKSVEEASAKLITEVGINNLDSLTGMLNLDAIAEEDERLEKERLADIEAQLEDEDDEDDGDDDENDENDDVGLEGRVGNDEGFRAASSTEAGHQTETRQGGRVNRFQGRIDFGDANNINEGHGDADLASEALLASLSSSAGRDVDASSIYGIASTEENKFMNESTFLEENPAISYNRGNGDRKGVKTSNESHNLTPAYKGKGAVDQGNSDGISSDNHDNPDAVSTTGSAENSLQDVIESIYGNDVKLLSASSPYLESSALDRNSNVDAINRISSASSVASVNSINDKKKKGKDSITKAGNPDKQRKLKKNQLKKGQAKKASLDFFGFGDTFLGSNDDNNNNNNGNNGDSGVVSLGNELGFDADLSNVYMEDLIDHEGNYYGNRNSNRNNNHNNSNDSNNSNNNDDEMTGGISNMAALAMSVFNLSSAYSADDSAKTINNNNNNDNSSGNNKNNNSRSNNYGFDTPEKDFFGTIDPKDIENDPVLLRLSNPSPLRNKKLFPDILYDLGIVDIEGKVDLTILDEDINLMQGMDSRQSTPNKSGAHTNSKSGTDNPGYLGRLDKQILAKLSEGSQLSNYLRMKLLFLQIRNALVFSWSVLYMVIIKSYNFFAVALGLWGKCDDDSHGDNGNSRTSAVTLMESPSQSSPSSSGSNLNTLSQSSIRGSIRMRVRKRAMEIWEYISSVNGLSALSGLLLMYSYFRFRRYGTDNGD